MKIKIVSLLILILLTTCSDEPNDKSQNPNPTGNKLPTVWFFGDSITAGIGASTTNKRWTSKLCQAKEWTEVNIGTPAETLITASETTGHTHFFDKYQSAIIARPDYGKYIFISYGVNDCAFNFEDYTPELFATQLQTIITYANSKGWENKNIVVLSGYFANISTWNSFGLDYEGQSIPAASMERYNSFITAAQTIAANNAGVYFVNPFDSYDASDLSDLIHPNDAGYAAIAEYVASIVP